MACEIIAGVDPDGRVAWFEARDAYCWESRIRKQELFYCQRTWVLNRATRRRDDPGEVLTGSQALEWLRNHKARPVSLSKELTDSR